MSAAEAAPWALIGLLAIFLGLVLLLIHITRDP